MGAFQTSIKRGLLADSILKVSLQVIQNNAWPTDFILSRDFLFDNQVLSVLFKPSDNFSDLKLQLLAEVASADNVDISDQVLGLDVTELDIGGTIG